MVDRRRWRSGTPRRSWVGREEEYADMILRTVDRLEEHRMTLEPWTEAPDAGAIANQLCERIGTARATTLEAADHVGFHDYPLEGTTDITVSAGNDQLWLKICDYDEHAYEVIQTEEELTEWTEQISSTSWRQHARTAATPSSSTSATAPASAG
jgi:hypothetical protein